MINFNFGENLRDVRQAKGLSQEAMAYSLNLSQATYSRLETQLNAVDNYQVAIIAKVLGVTPQEILPDYQEPKVIASAAGKGVAKRKDNPVFKRAKSLLITLALSMFFTNVVYEMAKGFCTGMGTSEKTMMKVAIISAAITAIGSFVGINRISREG